MNSYIIVVTLWFGKACNAVHRHCVLTGFPRLVSTKAGRKERKREMSRKGNLLVKVNSDGLGLNRLMFLRRKTSSLNRLGYVIG